MTLPHQPALASQKGGAGKTTLSGHLSVAAEQAGFGPVVLVDTDPQHSLTYWWQARTANTPLLAQVDLANIRHGLETLQGGGGRAGDHRHPAGNRREHPLGGGRGRSCADPDEALCA
ncbi:MAG: ParA family protein [Acetobacteraceae bacterium]|nr:ParA family protein [Acetobacteraceae bacterium]